jgi:hypothetical protein
MGKPLIVYIAGRIERSRDRYGVIHCALEDYEWEKPSDEPPLTEFYHKGRSFLYSGIAGRTPYRVIMGAPINREGRRSQLRRYW